MSEYQLIFSVIVEGDITFTDHPWQAEYADSTSPEFKTFEEEFCSAVCVDICVTCRPVFFFKAI